MKMHRMLMGPALALAATAALSTAFANAPLDSNSLYGPGEVAVVDNVSVTNYLAPFTLDRNQAEFTFSVDNVSVITPARGLEVPPLDLSAATGWPPLPDLGKADTTTDLRAATRSPEVLPPGDTWVVISKVVRQPPPLAEA